MKNKAENHAKSAIISLGMSVQTTISLTTTQRDKILFLAIIKNCLKRPSETHTSQDQAMADLTVDLRQQLADQRADKDIVADCTRKQSDGTVGTNADRQSSHLHM